MEAWTAERWNMEIAALPGAHILQTWQWGQVKARNGWQILPLSWRGEAGKLEAAALVLRRALPIRGLSARLRVMYVPKGPLLDWSNQELRRQVLSDLAGLARKQGAIFIKIDPDLLLGTGIPGADAVEYATGALVSGELQALGWRFSHEQVQFPNTVLINLRPDLEMLLANMKQKSRYNVRLAERKGVKVRTAQPEDLLVLFQMYAETSVRDGFVIREEAYYLDLWNTFMRAGMAEPLIAEVAGEPVAGVVIFRFAHTAWYLNGMSRAQHREKMPSSLLQWEAMRRAKAAGCTTYDLWGAPDVFDESDPMWGVFRFKEGLGGYVARTLGAWDLPVSPSWYKLYTQVLPRILDWMRQRGRERTQRLTTGG
jgi:peptidoglycan pentaglycine glycine transferase (the first glycine)